MIHLLWTTHQWQAAKEEEVIAALFSAPVSPDPRDISEIARYHPRSKEKYLNFFYEGQIPLQIKKIHKI